jgi:hypothetical protein
LAVTHNSKYRITFFPASDQYTITHSGTNSALDDLPRGAFRRESDSDTQYTVDFAELPRMGPSVRIAAVYAEGSTITGTNFVEFGPLGETTRAEPTMVWLAAGHDSMTRYRPITVNPVTGLTRIGPMQAMPHPAVPDSEPSGNENAAPTAPIGF